LIEREILQNGQAHLMPQWPAGAQSSIHFSEATRSSISICKIEMPIGRRVESSPRIARQKNTRAFTTDNLQRS
jgi:hypothetical protein